MPRLDSQALDAPEGGRCQRDHGAPTGGIRPRFARAGCLRSGGSRRLAHAGAFSRCVLMQQIKKAVSGGLRRAGPGRTGARRGCGAWCQIAPAAALAGGHTATSADAGVRVLRSGVCSLLRGARHSRTCRGGRGVAASARGWVGCNAAAGCTWNHSHVGFHQSSSSSSFAVSLSHRRCCDAFFLF